MWHCIFSPNFISFLRSFLQFFPAASTSAATRLAPFLLSSCGRAPYTDHLAYACAYNIIRIFHILVNISTLLRAAFFSSLFPLFAFDLFSCFFLLASPRIASLSPPPLLSLFLLFFPVRVCGFGRSQRSSDVRYHSIYHLCRNAITWISVNALRASGAEVRNGVAEHMKNESWSETSRRHLLTRVNKNLLSNWTSGETTVRRSAFLAPRRSPATWSV